MKSRGFLARVDYLVCPLSLLAGHVSRSPPLDQYIWPKERSVFARESKDYYLGRNPEVGSNAERGGLAHTVHALGEDCAGVGYHSAESVRLHEPECRGPIL